MSSRFARPLLLLAVLLILPAPALAQTPVETEDLSDEQRPAAGAEDELMALERRAEQSFEEDDLETAIVTYHQLAERHREVDEKVRLLMIAAWTEHLAGRDTDALDTLDEVFFLKPGHTLRPDLYSEDFTNLFYEAQAKALGERDLKAIERTRQALDAMGQGDDARARNLLREALTFRADYPEALYNLALVESRLGNQEAALAGFERLIALAGRENQSIGTAMQAKILINLGSLYNERGLYSEAERVLGEAVELDPQAEAAWTNLGISRRRQGRKVPAAEAFRRAHELAPNNPTTLNNLALAYIDAEDWVSAVGLLADATKRFPDEAKMWFNLGRAQRGLGNESGAIESFETCIRLDSGNRTGYASAAAVLLANHYYESQQHEEAARQARRAIDWQPQQIDAWVYRGLAEQAMGDLAAAQTSLEEAKRLDPARADIHNNLGSVYFELGRLELAAAAFESALAIAPDNRGFQANLDAVRRAQRGEGIPTASLRRGAATPPPPPPPARVRPQHGIQFSSIDYSNLGLKGVVVESVQAGSPASRAGIQRNDLILKADGREVSNAQALNRYLYTEAPSTTIVLDLLRENRPQRIELRLE